MAQHAGALAAMLLAASGTSTLVAAPAQAALPDIRASQRNAVPGCATPERLMTFLGTRNGNLDSRFRDIARHYKTHGEAWRVRWDYAFFQMLVETNFLTFRKPGGGMGDVTPRQNNFAGIGATGGVPGDGFPNVATGVLAQIQHLVVYSGERVADPTAPRTRLKMDEIITKSKALGRPVTFQDLAGRWAVDRAYGRSIEWAAQSFRSAHCTDQPLASGDGGSGRHRVSANWPRPDKSSPGRVAARRDDVGEPVARANLGRETDRDERPDPPTSQAKRPLQRPAVTGSVRKSESSGEVASTEPERKTAQRVLPSAPPPVITPKSPAQTAAATPPPAPPSTTAPPAGAAQAAGPPAASPPAAPPTALPTAAPSGPVTGAAPARTTNPCKIFRASYGGPKTVLIQSQKDAQTNYTVLEVTAGREQEQTKAFMDTHARGGKVIGEFQAEAEALKKSFELCPGG